MGADETIETAGLLGSTWLEGNARAGPTYIAFADVLGFKGVLETYRLRDIAQAIGRIRDKLAARVAKEAEAGLWGAAAGDASPHIAVFHMSDSLVIVAREASGRALHGLIRSTIAAHLYAMQESLLLRSCITKGALYASDDWQIVVGEGLSRAFQVGESTGWAGSILDFPRIGNEPWEWNALLLAAQQGLLCTHKIPLGSECRPLKDLNSLENNPGIVLAWPFSLDRSNFDDGGKAAGILSGHSYATMAWDFGQWYWHKGPGSAVLLQSKNLGGNPGPCLGVAFPAGGDIRGLGVAHGLSPFGYDPAGAPVSEHAWEHASRALQDAIEGQATDEEE